MPDLDSTQRRLHDTGKLWPRAELLRAWNDGYREMLAHTQAVRRWRTYDLPPRHTYAVTRDWEDRHVSAGTVRVCTRAVHHYRAMLTWEVEFLGGVTPTAGVAGVTQLWELAYAPTDRHYRLGLPRAHQRLLQVRWDHRRLSPITVRELDTLDTNWFTQAGEPQWWTTGTGRRPAVEIYELLSTYAQSWYQDGLHGLPRLFESDADRTYTVTIVPFYPGLGWAYTTSGESEVMRLNPLLPGGGVRITFAAALVGWFGTQPWEMDQIDGLTTFRLGGTAGSYVWEGEDGADLIALGLGSIRRITSTERQYLPQAYDPQTDGMLGRVTAWGSTDGALAILESVLPDVQLSEDATPQLLPPQLFKYIRYYVWAHAFARAGEGRNALLADHYGRRFLRGLATFRRLANLTTADRTYVREPAEIATRVRPARVSLPPEFPAVF